MIKSSPEYKERADKTIYVEDLLEKRKEITKILKQNKREDLELIGKVMERLKETIEKFGNHD